MEAGKEGCVLLHFDIGEEVRLGTSDLRPQTPDLAVSVREQSEKGGEC